MLFAAGNLLGPYEILETIGAGGMGEVYRARDSRLVRDVAIKVVREELVGDRQRLRRFQQEAQAAAAFHHPNICVVHEIGESGGHHYIVMEYVKGRPLSAVISGGPLPADQVLDLAVQMADGLEEARSKGVIHRDIKPSNIMVTAKGQAKILDFGLAKTLAGQTAGENSTVTVPVTQHGTLMGTVPYMSPEQALGQPADHRSDLFSFGIVLYEIATGRRPFEGATTMAVLNEIINKTPKALVALNPEMPAALEPILRKALEKDPERRYQTAADMLSDLKQLKRDTESRQNIPLVIASKSPIARRSLRTIPILAAGAAMAAVVWLGFFREGGRQPATLYKLTQITRDSGLSYQPSISADGNFVVYASDRATGKDLDIWLQQVSGGQPVRLTATPGDEFHPSVSADGRRVAFEWSGQERGIFVVPALGGSPRLVAPAGRDAQISPDGMSVAYATGWYMQASEIRVVLADGGSDRKVSTLLDWAMAPLWMRDGRHLLLWAAQANPVGYDYWMVPASGGTATRTGTTERLQRVGAESMLVMPFARDPSPVASVAEGGVVIAARSGDGHDLWLSPLSGDRSSSKGVRITVGAGATNPSAAANGRIAFARLSVGSGLWMLPLDASTGRVTGELRRVWRENVTVSHPNVSADGKKLAYVSNRMGDPDVWVRDLETVTDRQLTSSKRDEYRAVISPDGRRVAFRTPGGDFHTMPSGGGVESKVCGKCGNLMSWSPDGGKLLYYWGSPSRFATLDLATGEKRDVVWHPTADVHVARISPDGRWITFTVVTTGSRITYVASLSEGGSGKPESWIRISGESPTQSSFWSPDGNLLYIYQGSGLWARKLRPGTKAPIGEAFLIQRFDIRFVPTFSANPLTKDSLYFSMEETTANIWLAEPSVQ